LRLLAFIAFITELLPIVFYLVFLKRNRGEGLWVIFLYCVLSILTEVLGGLLKYQYFFPAFNIVQFTLFSLFFYFSLQNKRFKYIPIIGAVVFYIIAIRNFTNTKFDSFSVSLASVFFIPYCILALYEMIRDPNNLFVYHNKKFWIIIAFLLYFSATLFLDLNYGAFSTEQKSNYWAINDLFEILKNILFCVAFIMKKRPNPEYVTDGFET
jgi:hypothetical protein